MSAALSPAVRHRGLAAVNRGCTRLWSVSVDGGFPKESAPRKDRPLPLRTAADWANPNLEVASTVFVAAGEIEDEQLDRLSRIPTLTAVELVGVKRSLAPLASSASLRQLRLTDPATIDGLDRLGAIESLALYCFPRIKSLEPLRHLRNLRRLLLSTPPGYDASRRCHTVVSLAPLGALSNLEWLLLRGILPARGRLDPLRALHAVDTLEISHVFAFTIDDYAALARALPRASGRCLRPYSEAPWAPACRHCGGVRVGLTAPPPRSPRALCPICQPRKLAAHVARWKAAGGP